MSVSWGKNERRQEEPIDLWNEIIDWLLVVVGCLSVWTFAKMVFIAFH